MQRRQSSKLFISNILDNLDCLSYPGGDMAIRWRLKAFD